MASKKENRGALPPSSEDRRRPRAGTVSLLAERDQAHRRLDAVDDQLLELRLAGKARTVSEGQAVVAESRQPGAAAVVVLAPRDRVEVAVAGVVPALGRQAGLVDR